MRRTVLVLQLVDSNPLPGAARMLDGLHSKRGGAVLRLRSGLWGEQTAHARPLGDRPHLALRRTEARDALLAVRNVHVEQVDTLPLLQGDQWQRLAAQRTQIVPSRSCGAKGIAGSDEGSMALRSRLGYGYGYGYGYGLCRHTSPALWVPPRKGADGADRQGEYTKGVLSGGEGILHLLRGRWSFGRVQSLVVGR